MTEAGTSTKVDEQPSRWSGELIAGLDWKRIAELARALSSSYGFKLGKTTVTPDSRTDFIITRPEAPAESGTPVRLTPWNLWMASGAGLKQFAADLKQENYHQGIFISPGGFAPSAQRAAPNYPIELVDAETLAHRLNSLPPQHRDFYFNLATAGAASTPSCPVCLRPLKLVDDSGPDALNGTHLPELRYTSGDIVGGAVRARCIEILPFCEVQFLQEVRTGDLVVHGVVTGDFICEGSVVLHPGAMLRGSVAAHSVIVRPGADMLGETRILNGKLESFGNSASAWTWRCENPQAQPGCASVSLVPH